MGRERGWERIICMGRGVGIVVREGGEGGERAMGGRKVTTEEGEEGARP
jgi:hypothetical protein